MYFLDTNQNTCDGDSDGVVNAIDDYPHNPDHTTDFDVDDDGVNDTLDDYPTNTSLAGDKDGDGID